MKNLRVMADATLPDLELWFPQPFKLTLYNTRSIEQIDLNDHEILLCRSTLRVNEQLSGIKAIECVATASSGTDHILANLLQQQNITLFDAKGSNAHAVADYILASIAHLTQRGLLKGNRAAVVGAGHVGSQVAVKLRMIGFEVILIDPVKQFNQPDFISGELSDLSTCDLICIHANLHNTQPWPSQNLFNEDLLSKLKPDVVLMNAARGGIVNEVDLLNTPPSMIYCTDVYANEPGPSTEIIQRATICTPHIAGHCIEAKTRAVIQLSAQIHQHYGLECRQVSPVFPLTKKINISKNWQEKILDHYNPGIETATLKAANDSKNVFLEQRAAHVFRHEIQWTSTECKIK